MQILLANAKIMNTEAPHQPWSEPRFAHEAREIAAEMAQIDIPTLQRMLKCSAPIAAENWHRFRDFAVADAMPALFAYNGHAYKHLQAATLSPEDLHFAQAHLWITCFLYGLLRPMDAIVPYRMEHTVALELSDDLPIHRFWKSRLTDLLIQSVKADDGILLHLSTAEYEQLFDWRRVCRELTVVQPQFLVRNRNGELKTQAVWAKACRGAMTKFAITRRISQVEELATFTHEGFVCLPSDAAPHRPVFVKE